MRAFKERVEKPNAKLFEAQDAEEAMQY